MAVRVPTEAAKDLDARERLFVSEYLKDLDPKRAGIAAGYSKTVASSKCYSWVKRWKEKPHVYAAVIAAIERRSRRIEVTHDRVLEEIGRVAFADVRKLYDETGRMKLPHELDDDTAAAVASMETVEEFESGSGSGKEAQGHGGALNRRTLIGYTKKVKLHDKMAALTLAARHLKMLSADVEVNSANVTFQLKF